MLMTLLLWRYYSCHVWQELIKISSQSAFDFVNTLVAKGIPGV